MVNRCLSDLSRGLKERRRSGQRLLPELEKAPGTVLLGLLVVSYETTGQTQGNYGRAVVASVLPTGIKNLSIWF